VVNPSTADVDLVLRLVLVKTIKEQLSDYLYFPKWHSLIAVL
jgi:hypothetical protein